MARDRFGRPTRKIDRLEVRPFPSLFLIVLAQEVSSNISENKTDDLRTWALNPAVARALAAWKNCGTLKRATRARSSTLEAVWWLRRWWPVVERGRHGPSRGSVYTEKSNRRLTGPRLAPDQQPHQPRRPIIDVPQQRLGPSRDDLEGPGPAATRCSARPPMSAS